MRIIGRRHLKNPGKFLIVPPAKKFTVRRNEYPGTCRRCSRHVEPGHGRPRKTSEGKWAILCLRCLERR